MGLVCLVPLLRQPVPQAWMRDRGPDTPVQPISGRSGRFSCLALTAPGRGTVRRALLQNGVDQAIAYGLIPGHEPVAVGVLLDPLHALAGVLGQDFVQSIPGLEHLLGVDLHVRRLSLKAAEGLVDHHPRMRQAVALAGSATREQNRAHAGRLADADGADVGTDELHGVVDREPCAYDPARGIDVNGDVLFRVLGLQEEHLRHHYVGHVVVDGADDEDQALLEKARINVISPLAAGGLLDDDRDQIQCTLVHDWVVSPDVLSSSVPVPPSRCWPMSVTSWTATGTSVIPARCGIQWVT